MIVTLKLDGRSEVGGSTLVLHNERLLDPLDDYTKAIAAVSKKRGKTEADHLELSRLEFLGGLYLNGAGEPCLPTWNLLRCLQEGAKRHKRGQDVLRGVAPVALDVPLLYDGPRDPDDMWRDSLVSRRFHIRKGVGVQRSKVMRTRPMFNEWSAEADFEVDLTVWDVPALAQMWQEAGRFCGLGELRPVWGRFHGTVDYSLADLPPSQDGRARKKAGAL